jgi:hypothetical protein
MDKEEMMHDLVRYGKIKANREINDEEKEKYFRVQVIEYKRKKYFVTRYNGLVLEIVEV